MVGIRLRLVTRWFHWGEWGGASLLASLFPFGLAPVVIRDSVHKGTRSVWSSPFDHPLSPHDVDDDMAPFT